MSWVSYGDYDGNVVNRVIRIPANRSGAALGPFPNTMTIPPGMIGRLRTILARDERLPIGIQNPASLDLSTAAVIEFEKIKNPSTWARLFPIPRGGTLLVVMTRKMLDQVEIQVIS